VELISLLKTGLVTVTCRFVARDGAMIVAMLLPTQRATLQTEALWTIGFDAAHADEQHGSSSFGGVLIGSRVRIRS
jgi:hypothetical protein